MEYRVGVWFSDLAGPRNGTLLSLSRGSYFNFILHCTRSQLAACTTGTAVHAAGKIMRERMSQSGKENLPVDFFLDEGFRRGMSALTLHLARATSVVRWPPSPLPPTLLRSRPANSPTASCNRLTPSSSSTLVRSLSLSPLRGAADWPDEGRRRAQDRNTRT